MNTKSRFPHWYIYGDVAFFILGCSSRKLPIRGHLADREFISTKRYHFCGYFFDKIGSIFRDRRPHFYLTGHLVGNLDFIDFFKGAINGRIVHFNDFFSLLSVTFLDGIFNGFYGSLNRKNVADFEKGGLHNDINSWPQADFMGNGDGVNNVELQFLIDYMLLYLLRQSVPYLILVMAGGQQKRCALTR